jgi:hypothetical protein
LPPNGRLKPNAQTENQIGRQKALQDHRDRQGHLRATGQTPRNDQTHPKQVRNLRGTNVLFKSDGDNVIKFMLLNG